MCVGVVHALCQWNRFPVADAPANFCRHLRHKRSCGPTNSFLALKPGRLLLEVVAGYAARMMAPRTMNAPPSHWCQVTGSRKYAAAMMITKTTLSLSIGATFDAWPS